MLMDSSRTAAGEFDTATKPRSVFHSTVVYYTYMYQFNIQHPRAKPLLSRPRIPWNPGNDRVRVST